MTTQRRNIFTFDRNYYINGAGARGARTAGTSALAVEIEEEEYEEASYLAEEEEEAYVVQPTEERREHTPAQRTITVRKVGINYTSVIAMIIATLGVVFCACTFLNTQSDIKQLNKQYKAACEELADIEAGNEVIAGSLLVANDREYIYNVAVGRLGMVYPDNNIQISYVPAETGYVHQFSSIPD